MAIRPSPRARRVSRCRSPFSSASPNQRHGAGRQPFWRELTLDQMSDEQWESLCDGCGKCCLYKLEDEDTEELLYTGVACRLLDIDRCRCSDYPNRFTRVPDCLRVRDLMDKRHWLPRTCAYRLLAEGSDLPPWHPLVTGDPDSVHRAGVSVRAYAVGEDQVARLEDHVIEGLA